MYSVTKEDLAQTYGDYYPEILRGREVLELETLLRQLKNDLNEARGYLALAEVSAQIEVIEHLIKERSKWIEEEHTKAAS